MSLISGGAGSQTTLECFSYRSQQIPCFLGQGGSGFLTLTPKGAQAGTYALRPSGGCTFSSYFSTSASIGFWFMLLSFKTLHSPDFTSHLFLLPISLKSPKEWATPALLFPCHLFPFLTLCFQVLAHSPWALYCPPVANPCSPGP